ncbi:MAG TPA: hypothetical protein VMY78_12490 [Solirubrobacteraceae bacterium]|nr:hypothetical protein [Solirubrobacteraceae bacterium]
MKRLIAVAAAALLVFAASSSVASAAPAPSFTATAGANQTVSLDASASLCQFGICSYNWRWLNGSRLGVQMGTGMYSSYRFGATGWKNVELRMTGRCFAYSTNICSAIVLRSVYVS